ncbi:amidase [Catenuloplanes indicus]|uniref:Amidase n=1 Tax=Catenuloplanes indicus TaxID=137267 RepID=A0AAE3W707_9ACTN|nr:amidase family protein [Catenuloplanes indicus]MDQ0369794.1 amidase [Catenuloplanes indicus]
MEVHEYASHDATGLRELIATGQVTPVEVEDAARRALAAAHADLNALTGPLYEPALTHDPDGPFGGVPFLIKDSGPVARGTAFRLGSRAIMGAVASADTELMARFRAAGLVTLGQTTAPEWSLSFATEPVLHGPTRNPWAPDRGVGGSSGGAAALVAAGAVPLAHASDGAGSIRVPAAACGLVGLKPTRGRLPVGPAVGEIGFGAVQEFALTRTVRDAARLLDAISAPHHGEKHRTPPPVRPYAHEIDARPEPLRVAICVEPWSGVPVDPEVADATTTVGELLEWLGHRVEPARPEFAAEDVIEALMLGGVASGLAVLRGGRGRRPDPSLLEAVSRAFLREAEAATALDVLTMLDAQHRVTHPVGTFFTRYDVLVTPTLGQLPAPHGTLRYDDPGQDARGWLRRILEYGPFTAPFNVSGTPAISLPLGQSRTGLPIGVQLAAGHAREDLLLRLAAQLEQAAPWQDRSPSLSVG